MAMAEHDTYVWQEGRRWHWRCSTCRITNTAPGYRRRMDADDEESDHCDGPVADAQLDREAT